jgi:hypothetical protein
MANSLSKPLPSKYEIAVPQTYDAFDLSAAKPSPVVDVSKASALETALKATAEKTLPAKPEKTAHEWIDSKDETPKVKEKDRDKFEAPDEDSGGPAGPQSTIEKFAATQQTSDSTTPDIGITREKRAVWVVHGMGQQIPFETLDSLANGLLDVLPGQQVTPRLRTVKIADQVLQRVELDVDGMILEAGST